MDHQAASGRQVPQPGAGERARRRGRGRARHLPAGADAGQLDYLGNGITQQNLSTYQKQNPQAQTITNWGPGDAQIYYKTQDPASPFKDIRLRQAMSLALDRDALSKAAFDGKSVPCFYSPQSFGNWSLKMEQLPPDTAQYYRFDLTRAKQLASAAGAFGLSIKYLSPKPYPSSGENPWFT